MDFKKVGNVASVDHFLYQVGKFKLTYIVCLLKLAMIIFYAVFIGLKKLLCSSFGELRKAYKLVSGGFWV